MGCRILIDPGALAEENESTELIAAARDLVAEVADHPNEDGRQLDTQLRECVGRLSESLNPFDEVEV